MTTSCARPRSSWRRRGGDVRDGSDRPLQGPRRRSQGVPGGHQEGAPQARAPVPPGHPPGRRQGRGALQGDPGRLRRPVRHREAQEVRPRGLRGHRWPSLRRRARAGRVRRLRRQRLRRHPLQPVRRRGRRHEGDGPARPELAARQRPRGRGHDRLRPGRRRRPDPAQRPDLRALRHVPRHGRAPRHRAEGVPAVQRPGPGVPGSGPVLDLPAVHALQRRGHGDRGPVPDLPGQRRRAHGQALPGQHPRRASARAPASASPARARRGATAARPATCT